MVENLGIFWFRQDLRLHDNLALNSLVDKCNKIIPIYILDENIELGGASKWWLHHSLESLNRSLIERKSQIYLFKGSPKKILDKLVKDYSIKSIHWNRLYDEYSIQRDSNIKKDMDKNNLDVVSFKGSLINEPWTIKNKSGSFFKIFTPYWNTCLEKDNMIQLLSPHEEIRTFAIKSSETLLIDNYKLFSKKSKWTKILSLHWFPGEKKALEKFNCFKKKLIDYYGEGRDRPDKNYTSKLSPYLHFGEISPERIYAEIKKMKISDNKNKKKFLAEIGWREFSYNLLFNYPDIKTRPIQEKFKKFPWKKNSKYLKIWQEGKTGYPIVDAGMRQLYQTGWMHNRIRMIVGSFLCKNLLIHWWHGERWFFDTLVDADLGSNSSGWQWIAGCGADASPFFRIFNPVTQGLKFDPNGEYVKKYIPELNKIPSNLIHTPWELGQEDQKKYKCTIGKDYPKPIVELSVSRTIALVAYKKLKILN